MVEFELLRSLGIMLLAALGVVLAARVVRVPNIVAYIVAGLLLGAVLGVLEESHAADLISEIGIILLLFLVGLELSFDKIKAVGTTAFVAGGACNWSARRRPKSSCRRSA